MFTLQLGTTILLKNSNLGCKSIFTILHPLQAVYHFVKRKCKCCSVAKRKTFICFRFEATEVSTTAKSQSSVINHHGHFIVSEHKSKGKHFSSEWYETSINMEREIWCLSVADTYFSLLQISSRMLHMNTFYPVIYFLYQYYSDRQNWSSSAHPASWCKNAKR